MQPARYYDRLHSLRFENLESRRVLADDVYITEFLSSNHSSVVDEDGDHSPWLEIFNNSPEQLDLTGWHVTNDRDDLQRWSFPPNTTLGVGQFLRLFASGKNRVDRTHELHTNFALESSGGFLAIVRSDLSLAHAYSSYPQQFRDISYGIEMPYTSQSDSIQTLVPTRDLWIRQSDPNRSYENEGVLVAEPSVFGEHRWGIAEWDLTTINSPIVSATMEFSRMSRTDAEASQLAFDIPHGVAGLSWNSYQNTKAASEIEFEALGRATVPLTGLAIGSYVTGQTASASDVAQLNRLRDTTGMLTVAFKSLQGSMSWEDGANVGGAGLGPSLPIRLRLELGRPFQPTAIDNDEFRYFTKPSLFDYNQDGSLVLTDGVMITEVMSDNDKTFIDDDQEFSDWIELYNASDTPADLSRWSLTDDVNYVHKWMFPSGTILRSGEYLLIYASGKNRADLAKPFHTNFRLGSTDVSVLLFDSSSHVRHELNLGTSKSDVTRGVAMPARASTLPISTVDAPPGALYRVDFGDASRLRAKVGLETRAAAASFRFADAEGLWNQPTVPRHQGGYGGITNFSRTLVDSHGEQPIVWRHLAGDSIRAATSTHADPALSDVWFITAAATVDWQIEGLVPGAIYELYHYGGWPLFSQDDERITVQLDTDGDGEFDALQVAGLTTGGPHGVLFPHILADPAGIIRGRWQGTAGAPSWASTSGFQLARITNGLSPVPVIPDQAIDLGRTGYFLRPTPGARNGPDIVQGFVEETKFSTDRGFFESTEAFDLVITTATPNAQIYYTRNGSEPVPGATGTFLFDPAAPIWISFTSVVRAAAFRDDWHPSHVDSHTYIFVGDVVRQRSQPPLGWPTSSVNGQRFDFGMDPEITTDPVWGPLLNDALKALSTISITTDITNLTDPTTGIYVNARGQGMEWERPASVELINADGTPGFQINAGIRPRGNFSATGNNPKHSFRLFFREAYGEATLDYPLFGEEGVSQFKKLDLRTDQNDSWPFQASTMYTFVHDVFARDSQRDTGQPYTRSRYHHLYLNGIYWGLYESQERAEANYGASYFGGNEEDYDVIKSTGGPAYRIEATDGNLDAWFELWTAVREGVQNDENYFRLQGLDLNGVRNPQIPVLLDVDNLIDYMIGVFYTGDGDRALSQALENNRPNNFIAIRNRYGNQGFQFFAQDAETTLLSLHNSEGLDADRVGPFAGSNQANFLYSNPQWIHQDLMVNEQYRHRFQDRVHQHFFNGGAFSPEAATARFLSRAQQVAPAIVAESARWGDAHSSRSSNPLTYNDWQQAVDAIVNSYLPFRTAIVLEQLRNAIGLSATDTYPAPLYPSTDAPTFNQHGGSVGHGFQVTMRQLASQIYFDTVVANGDSPAHFIVPTDDSISGNWQDPSFSDLGAWSTGPAAIGYEQSESDVINYTALIQSDVESEMAGKQTSVLVRIPFDNSVALHTADQLLLRMKFDDGFVAYIDGALVAYSDNVDLSSLSYRSTTNAAHDDAEAVVPQEFDITHVLSELQEGPHVLAIHGINQSLDSNDFLLTPTLIARRIDISPPADPIYYTLDGTDPRQYDPTTQQYSISPTARNYPSAPPEPLDQSLRINARALSARGWSAINSARFIVAEVSTPSLSITEINYNPSEPNSTERSLLSGVDNDDFEFLEVMNTASDETVQLAGMRLTGGVEFTFDARLLSPKERVLVVKNREAFVARYGPEHSIAGEWQGNLSNGGETIRLISSAGATLFSVEYDDNERWPARADGLGASLELVDELLATSELAQEPSMWRGSTAFGGSPGVAGSGSVGVLISEVVAAAGLARAAGVSDTIELHNTTNATIIMNGWYLSDSSDRLRKFAIPDGTALGPHEFITFDERSFNPTPHAPDEADFALNGAEGEEVWLVIFDGQGRLQSFVDNVVFGPSYEAQSLIRPSTEFSRLVPAVQETLGCRNSALSIGSVILSEVHYHPAAPSAVALSIDPTMTAEDLEFLEFYNPTGNAITLDDWRVRGGIEFEFPNNTLLLPHQTLVWLSFDPTNVSNNARAAAFRAHYSLDASIVLHGGWSGALSNNGEYLALQKPLVRLNGSTPVVVYPDEEIVLYDDRAPWSIDADGLGSSLHRNAPTTLNPGIIVWRASPPSPGRFAIDPSPLGDLTGDRIVDTDDIDLLLDVIDRAHQSEWFDLDRNGAVNSRDLDFLLAEILDTSPGDANLDRSVDAIDFALWDGSKYRDCGSWSRADFNGDGVTDGSDFGIWNEHKFSAPIAAVAWRHRVPRSPLSVRLEN